MITRQTLFSPDDPVTGALVAAIAATAANSIRVAMFAFTQTKLAEALVAAKGRGWDVQVVLDSSQSKYPAQQRVIGQLQAGGVPVVSTTAPGGKAIMHHKFAVLGDVVLAGSFNWSSAAAREANHLDIEQDAGRAARFLDIWNELWAWGRQHPGLMAEPPSTERIEQEE